MSKPRWLPDLVFMNSYNSYNEYIETLYEFYKVDFIDSKPSYENIELSVKRFPEENGKDATFWHLLKHENCEYIDFKRGERIRWASPICYFADKINEIKIWENKRKNETRILLWFEEMEYLVVLAKRSGYILFWTAYPVLVDHHKRKLEKEYQAYING